MMLLIALAALPSVFGLQLGAPLTLPECAHANLGVGQRSPHLYDREQAALCQKLPGVEPASDPSDAGLTFPVAAMPAIVAFPDVFTVVIDGKLEALRAATLSHNNADAIIDELTKKFGAPSERRPETVEVHKIDVPSVQAYWRRDGYIVEYHAIGPNLDYGWMRVETDKARAARIEREKAVEAQRTPL